MNESFCQNDTLSLELSTVVEDFCDVVFFVDAGGSIIGSTGPVYSFFRTRDVSKRKVWSVLGLGKADFRAMAVDAREGDIREIFFKHTQTSYCLRIISLPAGFSQDGSMVVIVTSNSPLEDLCDTYEQRITDNITAWDDSITLFHALFETTADPTFLADPARKVLSANQAAKSLYSESFSPGRDCLEVIRPADEKMFLDAMRTLRPGKTWTTETHVYKSDDTRLPVELTLRRVDLDATRVYHIVLRDLSELNTLEKGLHKSRAQVEGMNVTLRNVLNSVEEEKQDLREEISLQVKEQILPALARMAHEESPEVREDYCGLLKNTLAGVASDATDPLDVLMLKLTPKEMEISRLVASGQSSKQIAELLGSSFDTVQTHRKNIRRKLGIRGKGVSLYAFLNTQGFLNES